MKLLQLLTLTLILTSAACTNSTRDSTGTQDTGARGGSTIGNAGTADASPTGTPSTGQ